MANPRWRKINQFFAVSGIGKKQPDFNSFLEDADIDTRENCEVEIDINIETKPRFDCAKVYLVGKPVYRRFRRFRLTYDNPTPQQIFRMIAYKNNSVTSPTGTPANEVQTLARTGTVNSGTFPLGMTLEGRTGGTAQIPYDATTAAIQAAIESQFGVSALGKIIRPGDVVVGGSWGTGITFTFAKRLRNANLPMMTVGNGLIGGGGSLGFTETTPGAQNYHTSQPASDGSKALFTVATGDENESIATLKYGDAIVESVDFVLDSNNVDLQMIVTILCNFNPEATVFFDVPDCVISPPIKTEDCRLKINNNFEQRDLVSHRINLNDNVPVNSAFLYDDFDISRPFARGNQPTFDFQSEIYGDANHALYALALNSHVEGNEVEFITHLGNPGNRVSLLAPETKIEPRDGLEGFAGEADESTIKFSGTPFGITGLPLTFEAYLDQSVSFLQT